MKIARIKTESYMLFHKIQLPGEILGISLQECTKELTKTPTTRKVTVSVPSVDTCKLIGDFSAQSLLNGLVVN